MKGNNYLTMLIYICNYFYHLRMRDKGSGFMYAISVDAEWLSTYLTMFINFIWSLK